MAEQTNEAPSVSVEIDSIRPAFSAFRADPAERLRVRVRRERARQVRELLANPEAVDLVTFNREVWAFESDTRLRGESIKGVLFGHMPLSSERIAELNAALDAGELELHGNYVWGAGAKLYGIQLRETEEEKLAYVRAAVAILNDGRLSPTDKAKRIIEIPGLGRNTATGMVMLFHPEGFNLWNGKSEKFAERLGQGASTLDKFERLAGEWRELLGAEDALELDWFLCRVTDGVIDITGRGAGAGGTTAAPKGRCWSISLGEGGRLWQQCRDTGIVAIGWDFLGDYRQFTTKEEFAEAISRNEEYSRRPMNDAKACYQFTHEMAVGDHVFAKQGMTELYGIGVVESDYVYDPDRPEYQSLRRVKWLVTGHWTLPQNARVPLKTLTDVTKYQAFLDFALPLLKGSKPGSHPVRPGGVTPAASKPGYTIDDAVQGLFMPKEEFRAMLDSLARKKNVVLQGPPGVGKTFVARRLAYALIGAEDPSKVETVQFHQSYSYEDFIQGWRPKESGGFELRDGVFHAFCTAARKDPGSTYVFVIDEINRGNLSKILGELMMLIEADKRGPRHAIPLTYSRGRDDRFFVPENVHVIGTMNTADRSLAMVDYALRRRFTFIDLRPRFGGDAFRAYLAGLEVEPEVIGTIVGRMNKLNELIRSEKTNLGPGFEIGHSFFCPQETEADLGADWYRSVVLSEIAPLLREYWFDAPEKADELAAKLLA